MKKAIFSLFLSLIFSGCKSNPSSETPLTGIHQFKVVLFFSPYAKDLDRETFFKMAVASFQKAGDVRLINSDFLTSPAFSEPVLLLSYEGANAGSINVFAETEILINKQRIGSRIWNVDFAGAYSPVSIEMQGDKLAFKGPREPRAEISPQEVIENLVSNFSKAYSNGNQERPSFDIFSNFILSSNEFLK